MTVLGAESLMWLVSDDAVGDDDDDDGDKPKDDEPKNISLLKINEKNDVLQAACI